MSMAIKPRSSTTRVALYARYSSDNQRDASIEDQIRVCQAWVQREGWQVTACYTDHAISGSTQLRSGYQALLSTMRAGGCEVVLAESLDRLSRDQEHVAQLYKAAQFAGVRLITLSEGEISELHIGLKGTMGALYLKDLADKTRRGLEGRVRQGRSGGGLCYGYRVMRGPVDRHGEAERGLRAIDPEQAAIVRRVFEEFAVGEGPKAIVGRLNREGIAGPRGGIWQAGTLRGQARRDTGILRNRLYIGELVWNQRRWIKDPQSGKRVARINATEQKVMEAVPELRIVEQGLWERVQARLAEQRAHLDIDESSGRERHRFWEQKRARHVLTGLVFCGNCGSSFASMGRDYLACRTAQAKGLCSNTRSVRRGALEANVLRALEHELMRPELLGVFVEEFQREWNRLASLQTDKRQALQRELDKSDKQMSGLIDAIADGLRAPGLQDRLDRLASTQTRLRAELAAAELTPTPPLLHPGLAERYRRRVGELREAMSQTGGTEVREALRGLIARVEIRQDCGIELVGELSALFGASGVQNAKNPAGVGLAGFLDICSVKMDAGTGFEPVTFRL